MSMIKIGIPRSQWDSDRSRKWYSDIWVQGHRVRRALSKFKPEATQMLNEMKELRRAQRHGETVRDMFWRQFREIYLAETLAEQDKNTWYANRRAFDMVDEATNVSLLKQMTPDRLGRTKTAWINSGTYSQSTIARSIQALLAAMRWAEDRKFVEMQNWRTVKVKNVPPRLDYYTREGYVDLLSKLDGEWFTAALVMGRAGLRLGEMLHLEWEDVHFDSRQIIFRSKPHLVSVENPNGWLIKKDVGMTKIRRIPIMFPDLRQHLDSIKQVSGFVLGPNVSRLEHGFTHQLSRALKGTGVKTNGGKLGFPHILRHTFGSHLAQFGVAPQKIQAWMGHESMRMTERYSHLSPMDNETDINMVEKLCSGFDPSKSSTGSPRTDLSTLNAQLGNSDLSSEIHESTR